jgi:lysophospholipase L1-like esterase
MNEVPLGTWAGHADIPTTGTTFRDAYAMMLNKIHANYPLAKVYCCTLANLERDLEQGSLEHRPSGEITQDTQWLHEFNEAIRQIAPIMNCTVIEVESCGINQFNMATYMGDYNSGTGSGLHPNAAGHALIAARILNSLI